MSKKIRVWFTKTGEASYISHLDLQRVMGRAMRKAKLPVWYSKGFNPHIYMTFALPLSLGQESLVESVDFATEQEDLDFEQMAQTLSQALPRGIDVKKIYPVDTDAGKIVSAKYQIIIEGNWTKVFEQYNTLSEAIIEKKTKRGTKPFNLKEYIPTVESWVKENKTCFTLTVPAGSNGTNLNPALLLQFLEQQYELPSFSTQIVRVAIYMQDGQKFLG